MAITLTIFVLMEVENFSKIYKTWSWCRSNVEAVTWSIYLGKYLVPLFEGGWLSAGREN